MAQSRPGDNPDAATPPDAVTAGRGGGAPRSGGDRVGVPDREAALEKHRAERRGLYNSFGTAWSASFEAAIAPLVVAGGGWLLDRWLGIFPIMTVVFFLLGATGAVVRLFYAYRHKMEIEERNRPWAPENPAWAEDEKDDW